jgi:hypothetical protein
VLAIASYNAGPGNVARWVDTYGDPRDPKIDIIDWIELIPFGETRNYVQRVLENVEIYRNRLGGNSRLSILADLHRPNLPSVVALKDQPAAAPISIERAAPFSNRVDLPLHQQREWLPPSGTIIDDGLRLYYRDYAGPAVSAPGRIAVLCSG